MMIRQIKHLAKLQLQNLYGINVLRFSKDKSEKKKKLALAVTYVVLLAMVVFYVSGLTYGYILIGLADMIPAYVIMISSLIILFFTMFKAGSVIFQRNAYDILASLPVSRVAIVVSRFIRMYVENLALTILVMLPAMIVYGIFIKPSVSFYLLGFVVLLVIPLLPITVATLFGALITAIASRMKHKSLVNAALSVLLVAALMLGTTQMAGMEEEISIEMLQNLSETMLTLIGNLYPPALWFGNAMLHGDILLCLACVAGSILLFLAVVAAVSVRFHEICRGLYSTGARQNYTMEDQKRHSVTEALYKREFKRYVSSSVYVTNTIMSPILGLLFAIAVFAVGTEEIQTALEIPVDIEGMIPFLLAGIFCMMPTTCTSISLEGKEWWIIKSLPVRAKDLFDAKILLNLSVVAPFLAVSEFLLIFALKPKGLQLLWLVLIPVVMCPFSSVFGIMVNLKLPVMQWENEVTIVKQSASAFFGGIVGFLLILLCIVPVLLVPAVYADFVKLVICAAVLSITGLLYLKNNKVNLQDI